MSRLLAIRLPLAAACLDFGRHVPKAEIFDCYWADEVGSLDSGKVVIENVKDRFREFAAFLEQLPVDIERHRDSIQIRVA